MIIVGAFVLGFVVGWFRATRREGDTLDKWQYAAGHAIAFAIVGLALVVLLQRLGVLA
jgi:hypothetical protein